MLTRPARPRSSISRLTWACWWRESVMPGAHAKIALAAHRQQAAPAGADVEEALALAQHQLAADVVEFTSCACASVMVRSR